jgi:hypothetical protein
MIETFVLMELARQLTWSSERARLYHYRTKDQVEVDAVLETPDGRVIAIEGRIRALHRTADPALRRRTARAPDRCAVDRDPLTGGSRLTMWCASGQGPGRG